MDLDEIRQILELMREHDLEEFELERELAGQSPDLVDGEHEQEWNRVTEECPAHSPEELYRRIHACILSRSFST